MLKKVLKAIAKLEARAKTSDAAQLAVGSSLSAKLRNAIADLESRAKEHDAVAAAARQASQRLRDQLQMGTPVEPPRQSVAPAPVKKRTPSRNKPAPKSTPTPIPKAAPAKKPTATPKALPKAAAPIKSKPASKSKTSPTLADAILHVLEARRDQNAGGVKARQLHAEVQQAGYRFGGNNIENQMNYLNKTLRQHSARYKRAADGMVTLA